MTIIPKPELKTISSRTVIAEQQKYHLMDYNCDLKTYLVILNLPGCDDGNFSSINVLICFNESGNILNELLFKTILILDLAFIWNKEYISL